MPNTNGTPNPNLSPATALSPIDIINKARKAVPAVDFALGVAGIAAAGAVVVGFVGSGRAAFIILGGIFVAMLLLFAFSRLVAAQSSAIITAGMVLVWAVIVFFCIFLVFTVTAVAFEWPKIWAGILLPKKPMPLPIEKTGWSLKNCKTDADEALRAFAIDRSNTLRTQLLIDCKNPIAYNILGSEAFYRKAYSEAERYFNWALQSQPTDMSLVTRNLWKNNLASTQIETGKYSNAIKAYIEILDKTPSDGFRWDLGKAYLYQGQNDPNSYQRAIETLRGVNPTFVGKTANGRVQILLAAAYAGQSLRTDVSNAERQKALRRGKIELCEGIRKNEDFWRAVLNKSKPYPNASFKEEIRLLRTLGDGSVPCPPPVSN